MSRIFTTICVAAFIFGGSAAASTAAGEESTHTPIVTVFSGSGGLQF